MENPIKTLIETEFGFRLNQNQWRDIECLLLEIMRRDRSSPEEIVKYLKEKSRAQKHCGREKFFYLKKTLIEKRFPITSATAKIGAKDLFLPKQRPALADNWQTQKIFKPLKIFIEKSVKDSELAADFKKHFPGVAVEEIDQYGSYLKKEKFNLGLLKKPLAFIVKEGWDFIKPCPCTSGHLGCGYWILNLGFGCPFDCSYCFLQIYTNFPGIILPANLDDFFTQFDTFHKKLQAPIRLGTGEFCDSLALDHITGYSRKLIPYFRDKNVIFELKTKSNNIKNLLEINPPANIVISWSLNPQPLITVEEISVADLAQRLEAAKQIQDKGYKIGFHFDPVIFYPGWQDAYKELIRLLYSRLKPPFAWISIGTLRGTRELKIASQLRFPQSDIFYGELLPGEDKKLRYPQFLRKEIYKNMVQWIRRYDKQTPVYLCMENADNWRVIGDGFSAPGKIEQYLIKC